MPEPSQDATKDIIGHGGAYAATISQKAELYLPRQPYTDPTPGRNALGPGRITTGEEDTKLMGLQDRRR